jgi:hypothetical protein
MFELSLALSEITDENSETVHNQDLGLARALFLMSNRQVMCWLGLDVRPASFKRLLAMSAKEVKSALAMLITSGYMAWVAEQLNGANDPLVPMFRQLQYISTEFPDMAYYLARCYFVTAQVDSQEWKNADEAFTALSHAPCEFYEVVGSQQSIDALLGFLAVDNMEKTVAARNELVFGDDCVFKNAEVILRLFESICQEKNTVRLFYLNFGPKGDVTWIKNHICLYKPMTETAGRISGYISGRRIAGTSIDEIAQSQATLEQEINNLKDEFNGASVSQRQGTGSGGRGFVSNETDSQFLHVFHGRLIPHGYAREVTRNSLSGTGERL